MKAKKVKNTHELEEILRGLPERLAVAEKGVDPSTQQEYLAYTQNLVRDQDSEEDILTKSDSLFAPSIPTDEKKAILASLAHLGTPEAHRALERFVEAAGPELRDWGVLALQECGLFLEQDWGEPIGTILTGLGGEGNKLRYFFVVCSRGNIAFTDAQKVIIEQAYLTMCDRLGSALEEVRVHEDYATLRVLIPLDVAVGAVIEGGINECNERGSLLEDFYYVTNERIPTEAEIQMFLDGGLSGE